MEFVYESGEFCSTPSPIKFFQTFSRFSIDENLVISDHFFRLFNKVNARTGTLLPLVFGKLEKTKEYDSLNADSVIIILGDVLQHRGKLNTVKTVEYG